MSHSAKLAQHPIPSMRILVAEDNPINKKLIRSLLSLLGYDADIASNGVEALSLAQERQYAAVLMDLQMPIMDGLTATRSIRRLTGASSQVPIIALTPNGFAGTRQKCLAAGMNDFLTKPIEKEKFAAALARWISNPLDKQELTA